MSYTISDLIVETMVRAGVRRIRGLAGDSLNGLTDALRRNGSLAGEHVRHEEAAASAAAGETAITGVLAVCAASCAPGNEQVKGFTLDAARSVLSGRRDELIDLARTNITRRLFS